MIAKRISCATRTVCKATILLLALACISSTLQAQVTEYSSQAAFSAATSGLTDITFNGIAAPGSYVSYGAGPLVLSGATFTGNGSMFVIDPAYYGSSYADGGFLNSDYGTRIRRNLESLA